MKRVPIHEASRTVCLLLLASALSFARADDGPVSISATVEADEQATGTQLRLIVELDIEPGWHTYAHVPAGHPGVLTEIDLDLPDGTRAVGEWETPASRPDLQAPAARVYEGRVRFERLLTRESDGGPAEAKVLVTYQACTEEKCLPPSKLSMKVRLAGAGDAVAEFEAPFRLMVGDQPLNTEAKKMYPSPAVFDVDGDGEDELVVGDIFGSLNVYENENDGEGDPVWSRFRPLESADGDPIKVPNW